jgi:hypothetical protein
MSATLGRKQSRQPVGRSASWAIPGLTTLGQRGDADDGHRRIA